MSSGGGPRFPITVGGNITEFLSPNRELFFFFEDISIFKIGDTFAMLRAVAGLGGW
jgi:hypothetical protein